MVGGALEKKLHLVKWSIICTNKREGGLGFRRLSILIKTLLGKWCGRFGLERDSFWEMVMKSKYGEEVRGWCSRVVRESYGVGV